MSQLLDIVGFGAVLLCLFLAVWSLFRFRVKRPLNILDFLENRPASSTRRRGRRRRYP